MPKLPRWSGHLLWGSAVAAAFWAGSLREPDGPPRTTDFPAPERERQARSILETAAASAGGSASRDGAGAASRSSALERTLGAQSIAPGDLEALARQALRDRNPITRRLAFARLLEAMTPENAASIREDLVALGADDDEWRDFNYAWGALAGEEAFRFAAESEERDLEAVLTGWASANPFEAIAMIDNLPEEMQGQRDGLVESVVSGLADRDIGVATDLVLRLAREDNERAPQLMDRVAREALRDGDPAEVARWSESLPDGPVKGAAMRRVADRFVRTDPEAAAAWAEGFANEDYAAPVIREVGGEWAERDPVAAVSWLETLPQSPGQKEGLNSAFGDWEDRDPAAASEYLANMPDSPQRDAAISGFSRGYAWQDPLVAIAWAEDISDPGLRQESLTRAGQAFMRRDPEGAQLWLEVSGLPPEAREQVINPPRRRR